jgi:hypothetical protein
MKLKKAVGLGAILWVLIFFEVSILMFGFSLKSGDNSYYVIHFILTALFVIVLSLIYFKGKEVKTKKVRDKKAKKSNKSYVGLYEGLLLGLVFVGTGIILDAIITVPLFVKTYNFFADTALILGYLLTIVLCIIVGWVKGSLKR